MLPYFQHKTCKTYFKNSLLQSELFPRCYARWSRGSPDTGLELSKLTGRRLLHCFLQHREFPGRTSRARQQPPWQMLGCLNRHSRTLCSQKVCFDSTRDGRSDHHHVVDVRTLGHHLTHCVRSMQNMGQAQVTQGTNDVNDLSSSKS